MLPLDIEIDDLEKTQQVIEEDLLFYAAKGDLKRIANLEREWQAVDAELTTLRRFDWC